MSTADRRKSILCKYFVTYGDCFHGDKCHYLHALPPQKSPQPQPQPVINNNINHHNNHHHVELPAPTTPATVTRAHSMAIQSSSNMMLPSESLSHHSIQNSHQQQQGYNMNKLICSFKSELPNEIDFAMQIATLLANTNNFIWYRDYAVVDAICTSLHIYVSVCDDISDDYSYTKFWYKLLGQNISHDYLKAACYPPNVEPDSINFELFEEDSQINQKVYRRMKSAVEIIRQFSMTANQKRSDNENVPDNHNQYHHYRSSENNKKKPKASVHLLKLVSLLIHCQDMPLNLIGLDILSNVASKLCKVPYTCSDPICTQLVQVLQEYSVHSVTRPDGDIYIINRSIESISKILASSSVRVSTGIVSLIVEKNLVSRIEQFLTSHSEVTLFLSALEFCYILSRHQPHLIAGKTKYLVKILVNLLDCDDFRYFTPKALKRIKILVKKSDEPAPRINGQSGMTNGFRYYPPQSPLSVSVRLTAALILRNLAAESTEVKQILSNYEQLLSEICMTNGRDESKIIAECLSLLNDDSTRSQGKKQKL